MEFIIKIENGEPSGLPMLTSNYKECNPEVDLENLPPSLAFYKINPAPILGAYEKLDSDVTRTYIDGVVVENKVVLLMTEEEKLDKQTSVKNNWAIRGFSSWTFDEELCCYVPPVPYPSDTSTLYRWQEEVLNWVPESLQSYHYRILNSDIT
jgi:hypothetical protein